MCKEVSWSQLYSHRRQAAAQFGKIFSLPIVRRVRDVLADCIADGDRVLEVGAGDRHLSQWISQHRPRTVYRSLDIDPHGEHDFRSFQEVRETFQCAFALEVVEHLALEETAAWLANIRDCLAPAGRLVLSTPNTFYPPAFLRDVTHRTAWCYDELAGFVAACGFKVTRIVRIYHDPLQRAFLRRYAFGWLFRTIGIDFARQIALVARKD